MQEPRVKISSRKISDSGKKREKRQGEQGIQGDVKS
jgi:hypothetical protein